MLVFVGLFVAVLVLSGVILILHANSQRAKVLKILRSHDGEWLSGRDLKRLGAGQTVYVTLRSLQEDGLVECEKRDIEIPHSQDIEPVRRFYRITEAGAK